MQLFTTDATGPAVHFYTYLFVTLKLIVVVFIAGGLVFNLRVFAVTLSFGRRSKKHFTDDTPESISCNLAIFSREFWTFANLVLLFALVAELGTFVERIVVNAAFFRTNCMASHGKHHILPIDPA